MNAIDKLFTDPVLNELHQRVITQFDEIAPIIPASPKDYFKQLCASIISQQLSTKVAAVIEARVTTAIAGKWKPEHIINIDTEILRTAGLSNAKTNYIKNIAEAWNSKAITSDLLTNASDEDVIEQLVTIKGVGRWTAEMFLIFTLGRPDVFSAGDYGLRKAISKVYNYDMSEKPRVFSELAENWSPHRTLASRILWKSLELP